jgi:hypothetical protein
MSARSVIAILLAVMCVAAIWEVVAEGHQLSGLQAEQRHLEAANPETNSAAIELAVAPAATPEVPRELLQLRAEVARLSQQQRELAGAKIENEKLRLQLENRRTNSAAGKIGGGYMRISEVRWLGYDTPENTLQSFLWATKNHDLGKFLEAFTPEAADRLKEMLQNSNQQVFGEKLPPAYRISGWKENGTDNVELEIQITPDIPAVSFYFQRVSGQWKLQRQP